MFSDIRSDDRDLWEDQVRENSARLAFVRHGYNTEGAGEIVFEDVVDFGLTFTEKPTISYGFAMAEGPFLDEVISRDLIDTQYPRCTGGVAQWRVNDRGMYVGAVVFACVDLPILEEAVDPPAWYSIDHSYVFAGIAMKDVPQQDFPADDVRD